MKSDSLIPNILMPLPDFDFDPTEAAIPWKICKSRGWKITISTENRAIPQGDPNKLKGPLPGLISAGAKALEAYHQMTQDPDYQHPISYIEIDPDQYQALLLPGGDTFRMRQYLESKVLQDRALRFWQQGKVIGAICHGILVLARTVDPQTGKSILFGHKVTALPGSLDRMAYFLDNLLTKHGYLPPSVAGEVRECLRSSVDFSRGPGMLAPYVVSDGNLVTARWYMDAEVFGERFAQILEQR